MTEALKILSNCDQESEKLKISFSELLVAHYCPYKHWTQYVQNNRQPDTIYTKFGTAAGVAIEDKLTKNIQNPWISFLKTIIKFLNSYIPTEEELNRSAFRLWCKEYNTEQTIENWRNFSKKIFVPSALRIYKDLLIYFEKNILPEWDIVGFEIPLSENIPDIDILFKGYIDLILRSKNNPEKYKIIDFKTCKDGWTKEERNDKEKLYQVILYKKYWCEKNNIDFSNVECAYLLLKRQPDKKLESSIEIFNYSSEKSKMQEAEVWTFKMLKLILSGVKIKNKNTCKFCTCGAVKFVPKFFGKRS
jgi:hypothetical protein